MTKRLQIGKEVFDYPQQGTGAGYGEDATAWAEAVTGVLAEFSGPNDILLTQANLTNNSSGNITGLVFDTGRVQHVNVEFLIKRTDLDNKVKLESGEILGNYDGTDFVISINAVGDSGISIEVDNSGQFTYTSNDLGAQVGYNGHLSSVIYFKARTIDL